MSLADDIYLGQLSWAGLTAAEKRDAVYSQLVEGRTVEETTTLISVTYGPVGANAIRGVIDRHELDKDHVVRFARKARQQLERSASLARARSLKPKQLKATPLPVIELPALGNARKKTRITIWDLKPWQCRTPLWGNDETRIDHQFYCGQRKAPGRSCCEDCAKVLYAPVEERRAPDVAPSAFPKRGRYLRWK